MIGIYKITSPSGKIYIGQSINIEKRFKNYLSSIHNSKNQNKLNNSFIKYGSNKHIFEVIEECEVYLLNVKERYWQEYYKVLDEGGLNCMYQHHKGASGKLSKITKKKISESKKGCKIWNKGIELNYSNKRSKLVLDENTGVFYESCTEASTYSIFKRTTLNAMLVGQSKNKTNLRYV